MTTKPITNLQIEAKAREIEAKAREIVLGKHRILGASTLPRDEFLTAFEYFLADPEAQHVVSWLWSLPEREDRRERRGNRYSRLTRAFLELLNAAQSEDFRGELTAEDAELRKIIAGALMIETHHESMARFDAWYDAHIERELAHARELAPQWIEARRQGR